MSFRSFQPDFISLTHTLYGMWYHSFDFFELLDRPMLERSRIPPPKEASIPCVLWKRFVTFDLFYKELAFRLVQLTSFYLSEPTIPFSHLSSPRRLYCTHPPEVGMCINQVETNPSCVRNTHQQLRLMIGNSNNWLNCIWMIFLCHIYN